MKTLEKLLPILFIVALSTCKKDNNTSSGSSTPDNYSSISDFYSKNAVPIQTFNVDAVAGGSFTALHGTHVTVPPNAFTGAAAGNVTIVFKEIYKKSDMIFSHISTETWPQSWSILVSGGMFFIKATQNNTTLNLSANKSITVEQPFSASAAPNDTAMKPFIGRRDSVGFGGNASPRNTWWTAPGDTLIVTAANYVFSLYHFTFPIDSGTWCNSDNPSYFASYPQTKLKLIGTDNVDTFYTDVFLVFKNVNSMVHVYNSIITNEFDYNYAPLGLNCTVVAVGVRNGKLYSSFTPITISSNLSLNFTLTETTTDQFKAQLSVLN